MLVLPKIVPKLCQNLLVAGEGNFAHDFLQMAFDVVPGGTDQEQVVVEVIIPDVRNLCIPLALLIEVFQMVRLHLGDDVYDLVVEFGCQVQLSSVVLLQRLEISDVPIYLCLQHVEAFQKIDHFLVDGAGFVLGVAWQFRQSSALRVQPRVARAIGLLNSVDSVAR